MSTKVEIHFRNGETRTVDCAGFKRVYVKQNSLVLDESRFFSEEYWNELDQAAKSNLRPCDQVEFVRYKEQLQREGHAWEDDARDILAGFIWEQSEYAD